MKESKKDRETIRAIEKWTGSSRHDDLIFIIAMLTLVTVFGVIPFVILLIINYF